MALRRRTLTIYAAGLVQGVALVTFPAASAVLTSPSDYGLSSAQYGSLFVPQAILAIVTSLAGASLRSHLGFQRMYLLGLLANLLSMSLLVVSRFVMHDHSTAYGVLLTATTCMGIGFGLTVPALNTFAASFFPQSLDKAVLAMNALLGLGTALAPVFIAVFVGLGIWWGLPIAVCVLLVALLALSFRLPLDVGGQTDIGQTPKVKFPTRFWVFAAFVLLYGICEAMNGNWASLYMTSHFGASAAMASVALALFWGAVTAGRILFAFLDTWFPERWVFRILPLVVLCAFVIGAVAPNTTPAVGLFTFGLAGLGCSALLPLAISFGQRGLTAISTSVAGGMIGFYQIGFGLAAFGAGPLQSGAGLDLHIIYGSTSAIALAMLVLSFVLTRHAPQAHPPARGVTNTNS